MENCDKIPAKSDPRLRNCEVVAHLVMAYGRYIYRLKKKKNMVCALKIKNIRGHKGNGTSR
jgi:hypothetical protein